MTESENGYFQTSMKTFFKYLIVLNVVQFIFLGAMILFPDMQKIFIYGNWLSLTFGYPLEPPSAYGPFKSCHHPTQNDNREPLVNVPLKLNTADGLELGAWHISSNATEQTQISPESPFLLYFHGNSATRALKYRTETYKSLFQVFPYSQLLVIDYRGFGDSEGAPSEQGLLQDAITAWNYVTESLKGN